MTYDQLPAEWKDWLSLPPLERFARGERMLVEPENFSRLQAALGGLHGR